MIIVLCKKSKFFIFDHGKNQNGPYLAKTEKRLSKFSICCVVYGKLLLMYSSVICASRAEPSWKFTEPSQAELALLQK